MQFLWKYIDDLVGKGLDVQQIAQLLFYASARFVPIALPIAILLSSVMLFGKMGEQYELVALKSSGVSFLRTLYPLTIFVIIISFGSFLFSNYVMPIANLKNGSMIYNIQKKKPALNIKEGVFYKNIEGYSIKIAEKEQDGTMLKDIIIYNHTDNKGNNKVIVAESGKMQLTKDEQFLELILYNGHSYFELADGRKNKNAQHRTTSFKEDLIRFSLSSFNTNTNSEHLYKGHYAMLNNKQLNFSIDSLNIKLEDTKTTISNNIKDKYTFNNTETLSNILPIALNTIQQRRIYDRAINKVRMLKSICSSNKDNLEYKIIILTKHQIEWHRKIALAVACFILFFMGAPLGAIIRKGGFGMPVMVSIFFFLLYHVLNIMGEKSAKDLSIFPHEGMWLANAVFIPISLFLVHKISRDISFDSMSFITNWFIRFKKR